MSTKTEGEYITVDGGGTAWIKEVDFSVGDLLALIFLFGWREEDLIDTLPGLTPESINAALAYAADNPDTVEGSSTTQ